MAGSFVVPYQQIPFASSQIYQPSGRLVDLIRLSGEQSADAQRRAGEIQAQMWGNLGQSINQGVGNIIRAKQEAPINALNQQKVDEGAQLAAGRKQLDTLLAPQTPQGPAEGGGNLPSEHPYLDANGLYDVPKLTAALANSGVAHLAPELLKSAEAINESITKHQATQAKLGEESALLYGDMADGVLKMTKAGIPIDQALDLAAAPGLATKRFDPQQFAQIKAKLLALPPDQQQASLGSLMDAASKVGGNKTLGKDAQELDRYGRVVASNIVPEKPTEAVLAADAATLGTDKETPTAAASKRALDLLKPPKDRTAEEQALDAYAKSIGKAKAEDLTYADRKQYEKDHATTISNQAFVQHQREREYDIAHPIPTKGKSQSDLEQEYRTVLARGLSSRSGGLGMEDAKVQQANHLLSLMDQNRDPKTGDYNIPNVQYQELALGMAKLLSSNGAVGEGMKNDLVQATAQGDLKKVATYLTGTPFNGSTQDVFKMLRDSIERQGSVAMENREGEMRYLRGLAPTDLEEARRQKLEETSLNPLRQSRIIANPQTGEHKIQVSLDGGKTWK